MCYCGKEYIEALMDRGYREHDVMVLSRVIMPELGKRCSPTESRKERRVIDAVQPIESII